MRGIRIHGIGQILCFDYENITLFSTIKLIYGSTSPTPPYT
jgi:hypothetical protein